MTSSPSLHFSSAVQNAFESQTPVVGLESTVLTHGLPYPQNLEIHKELEGICKESGTQPATLAIVEGTPTVGLSSRELELFAKKGRELRKFSGFDLPVAYGLGLTGSLTVAGSLQLCHRAGIKTFATGGIGGVHRGSCGDVSYDIKALSLYPVVTVSAGCKAILDLPKTLEALESAGVLVVGYRTDEFPGFYYRQTGLKLPYHFKGVADICAVAKKGLQSALLVANPIPTEAEIPREKIEPEIIRAQDRADLEGIQGKELTPFLLNTLAELTADCSVACNKALLKNNVKLATQIARGML